MVVCSNPAEDCPNCPRWMDDCEGLEEFDELLEEYNELLEMDCPSK